MKKTYQRPAMEFEAYELDMGIASNCALVVDMGPEGPGDEGRVCQDYYDKTGETPPAGTTLFSLPHNIQFWTEETCDCYTSAGSGCFTS